MHYMQEKTKEMDSALTNNMEEYQTQKKAREKRLMAYAEEIQKNTLQMSSALIAELVAERKYQKKTQQDIADITGIFNFLHCVIISILAVTLSTQSTT